MDGKIGSGPQPGTILGRAHFSHAIHTGNAPLERTGSFPAGRETARAV